MPSRTTAEGIGRGDGDFSPEALSRQLAILPAARRYLVALSGGLDSTVLLHALAHRRAQLSAAIAAVHIDHGLSPHSKDWADHCADLCRRLGIPLTIERLQIARQAGHSPEAAAREARYAAVEALMEPGDALLTAHQRDDQAETLLLLLLRGSGPRGLSAMPAARPFGKGWLLRPLLGFDRAALEAYAKALDLRWIEDESNRETRFDRNFLRRRVMPLLRERWPAASATLARSAHLCAEVELLVREQTEDDLTALAIAQGGIPVEGLLALSDVRQRAAVRLWLDRLGLPTADHRRLAELLRQAADARADRTLCVRWPGAEVHRYKGVLVAHAPLQEHDEDAMLRCKDARAIALPAGLGTLEIAEGPVGDACEVRFRAGGERLRSPGGARAVKKILQDACVPPWVRSRVPLLYSEGVLVSVGDYKAAAGWRVRWHRGDGWPRALALPPERRPFDEKNR